MGRYRGAWLCKLTVPVVIYHMSRILTSSEPVEQLHADGLAGLDLAAPVL